IISGPIEHQFMKDGVMNWTGFLTSGPLVMVLGFLMTFWLARGAHMLFFLKVYKRPVFAGVNVGVAEPKPAPALSAAAPLATLPSAAPVGLPTPQPPITVPVVAPPPSAVAPAPIAPAPIAPLLAAPSPVAAPQLSPSPPPTAQMPAPTP